MSDHFQDDVLAEARTAVTAIMRGKGGRGAMSRLAAAKLILEPEFLRNLSDEALLAEVKRRADAKEQAD